MKKFLYILFLLSVHFCVVAQTDTTSTVTVTDTALRPKQRVKPKPKRQRVVVDTINRSGFMDTAINLDSTGKKDSAGLFNSPAPSLPADSTVAQIKAVKVKRPIDSFYLKILDNPFLRTTAKPVYLVINERQRVSKDYIFYLLAGMLLFLAFIKLVFNRYFSNIFRLFFQPSFRQKQTREQLLQNNLPSLLLNLFFILSAGSYISFLFDYYHFSGNNFWLNLFYCTIALTIIYLGKYIFLRFAGWVFDVKEAVDAYIFAVYLINKILGVLLVPFILIIAFSDPAIINTTITISILIILLLFIYRYLVSYSPVRREVKVHPIHFFFYVCAFEITPLLLIYKTLNNYLANSL